MRKRLFKIFLLCGPLAFVFIFAMGHKSTRRPEPPAIRPFGSPEISCYFEPSTVDGVQDFYASNSDKEPEMPEPGRSIFLLETSCFGKEGVISFKARQACAVESAALMNPKMMVYLLLLSPAKLSNQTKAIFERLQSYENVRIRRIFLEDYVKNTPLEVWYASGALGSSKWPIIHMSDSLRYLTLWKFPGMYLDLDFVVTKCLDGLSDFAGAEDSAWVANAALDFSTSELGRQVANASIHDLTANFRGDSWGHNGPGVITRTLQKICGTQQTKDMTPSRCNGFTVYPPSVFYPISYNIWKDIFVLNRKNETMKKISEAKTIHMWNALTSQEIVKVGSEVPYDIIAKKHCPKIHQLYIGKTM